MVGGWKNGMNELLLILESVKEEDQNIVEQTVWKHFILALEEIELQGIDCTGTIGRLMKWPTGVGNKP